MPHIERWSWSRIHKRAKFAFCFAVLLFLFAPSARSQQQDMDNMPGMNMSVPAGREDAARAAKLLADKRESEFNHRLAGAFVILAGILILYESRLAKSWVVARYIWPLCFLAAGLFVLVYSDTEMWPFGHQSPWYAITHDPEDLQHKVFAIILLALGYVELQRARGRLKAAWAAWFFPVTAMVGAILLLFHVHRGDMHAPHAMQMMQHIQEQHRWFAAVGLGIALTNGLAKIPRRWQQFFSAAWPTLLVVLGLLLTLYTE